MSKTPEEYVRDAIAYIDAHYHEQSCTAGYVAAEVLDIDPIALNRHFDRTPSLSRGVRPKGYQLAKRRKLAAALAAEDDLNLSALEISVLCGYRSVNPLQDVFKQAARTISGNRHMELDREKEKLAKASAIKAHVDAGTYMPPEQRKQRRVAARKERQLQRGVALLRDPQTLRRMTIQDIALSSGFPNISAFGKTFVAAFDVDPTKYRQRLHGTAKPVRLKRLSSENEAMLSSIVMMKLSSGKANGESKLPSASAIARTFGVSSERVRQIFVSRTGMSVAEFVHQPPLVALTDMRREPG